MPRALRQRASRPNYAALFHYEDEDGAGPSNSQRIFDDEGSGSDFAPEKAEEQAEDAEDDDELDEDAMVADEDDVMSVANSSEDGGSVVVAQPIYRVPKKTVKKNVSLAPGISARQQSLVIPSSHHRHRAVPLYAPPMEFRVERLASRPLPFQTPKVVPTNHFAYGDVLNRLPKSWSYNVGRGPLWELLEDRACYSEAALNNKPDEKARRPRVHQNVRVTSGSTVIRAEEAEPYLPKGVIRCSFGPFGQQERINVEAFDTINMNKYFPDDISHVFSAGAPVWAIDWCPIHPDDRQALQHKQYLAVGPLLSHDHVPTVGSRDAKPACIQIWSINSVSQSDNVAVDEKSKVEDHGYMRCEMVLCIDNGPAHYLKWCPLPSNDPLQASSPSSPRKLGLLAGTFCDGTFCVYAVPYPDDVAPKSGASPSSPPVFVKMAGPLIRIDHPETTCWSFDWANSEVVAIGFTNGTIAVYSISDILATGDMTPTHFLNAHQSAIRSLAWVRTPTHSAEGEVTTDSPTVIVSTSYDGVLHIVDIRAPCGNDLSRTRDALNTVCFSIYNGGPLTIDQSFVKAISIAPILLNKGHTLLDTDGPVWHIGASDYHPQIACAVTDGSLTTTNTYRNTRRGGSVTFFEHRVYQMDYNSKTKEYRMLDHLKPREVSRTAGTAKGPPKGTGAWAPEVGVHRAVWNDGNGLASAPWLASATASGLCRVDWLQGKWLYDRIPYDGVDGIRLERDTPDDEANDSD